MICLHTKLPDCLRENEKLLNAMWVNKTVIMIGVVQGAVRSGLEVEGQLGM